jgi:AcrR family transcriptional regulator
MPRIADPTGRRRKEILANATELFARRGFHGTSMGDLARLTALNKGTLYHYYPSKSHLLYEIYIGVAAAMMAKVENLPVDVPAKDRLRRIIRGQLEVIVENPAAVRVYYRESSMLEDSMDADSLAEIRRRENVYASFVHDAIRRGINSGEFRRVNAKLAAFGVIGLVGWVSTWYDPDGSVKVGDLATLYGDMTVDGLSAKKK